MDAIQIIALVIVLIILAIGVTTMVLENRRKKTSNSEFYDTKATRSRELLESQVVKTRAQMPDCNQEIIDSYQARRRREEDRITDEQMMMASMAAAATVDTSPCDCGCDCSCDTGSCDCGCDGGSCS